MAILVNNERNRKNLCQVEACGDDEQEAGLSKKKCMQEVPGKLSTGLKQHMEKHYTLQYEEVVKLEEAAKKMVRELRRKERGGELLKGQATLQQAFVGRTMYGKTESAIVSFLRSLHC